MVLVRLSSSPISSVAVVFMVSTDTFSRKGSILFRSLSWAQGFVIDGHHTCNWHASTTLFSLHRASPSPCTTWPPPSGSCQGHSCYGAGSLSHKREAS